METYKKNKIALAVFAQGSNRHIKGLTTQE